MNSLDSEPGQRGRLANRTNIADQPPAQVESAVESALVIPVIQEELTVEKRVIETGQVRLVKTVHQEEQVVSLPLLQEEILVERVPMDQLVDQPPGSRQEGDTMIYPVLREEIVVVKRLRLVEEIRVTKRAVQTTESQTVTLRREEITVDRSTGPIAERSDSPGESSLYK